MIPRNREHMEALQAKVNEETAQIKKTMTPEQLVKVQAVEDAIKILSDAKVPFYLFPLIPTQAPHGKDICVQYNNMAQFIEYNDAGHYTEKDKVFLQEFNLSFVGSVGMFLDWMLMRGQEFSWDIFQRRIGKVIHEGVKYNKTGKVEE